MRCGREEKREKVTHSLALLSRCVRVVGGAARRHSPQLVAFNWCPQRRFCQREIFCVEWCAVLAIIICKVHPEGSLLSSLFTSPPQKRQCAAAISPSANEPLCRFFFLSSFSPLMTNLELRASTVNIKSMLFYVLQKKRCA